MLGFMITLLVISSIMGNQGAARNLLRTIFTFIAVIYGIQIILYTGLHLLPLIIIIWAVMNIVVPFIKGFVSSFQKS